MTRLRRAILAFIVWASFIFNIEGLFDEPVNLASLVYVLIALVAIATVGWKRLGRVRLRWALLSAVAIYLPGKVLMGYPLVGTGTALPKTVTEVAALWLTVLLARLIFLAMDDAETALTGLMVQGVGLALPTFAEKQDDMYAEVHRARRFKRPLTLTMLQVDSTTLRTTLPHVVEEVQQTVMERFAFAKVARLLRRELVYPTVVAQDHGTFYLLMPELPAERADDRAKSLADLVRARLNMEAAVGVASFPDQALTLERLVEVAKTGLSVQSETTKLEEEPIRVDLMPRRTEMAEAIEVERMPKMIEAVEAQL